MCARSNVDSHRKKSATAKHPRRDVVELDLFRFFVIKAVAHDVSRIDLRIRFRSPGHHGCAHIHGLSYEPHGAEKQHEANRGPGCECAHGVLL